jgi:hypothetical protein
MSDVTTYELDAAAHYQAATAEGLVVHDFPAGTVTPADDSEAAALAHLHATGQARIAGQDTPAPAPKRARKTAATQED